MLGIQATREGCSSLPQHCMDYFRQLVHSGVVRQVYASVAFDPATAADYSAQYAAMSRHTPWLVEVGFDDFVSQYDRAVQQIGTDAALALLQQAVQNFKRGKPNLKFGITLYEDEVEDGRSIAAKFPGSFRDSVDYVHFYVHYRENGPKFAQYIGGIKRLFPKAKLIGGVYAYDRIDYVPCAPGSKLKCSVAQELDLFSRATDVEVGLARRGVLDALETIPGHLGTEAAWWKSEDDPRACATIRIRECVANTVELRSRLLDSILPERSGHRRSSGEPVSGHRSP